MRQHQPAIQAAAGSGADKARPSYQRLVAQAATLQPQHNPRAAEAGGAAEARNDAPLAPTDAEIQAPSLMDPVEAPTYTASALPQWHEAQMHRENPAG